MIGLGHVRSPTEAPRTSRREADGRIDTGYAGEHRALDRAHATEEKGRLEVPEGRPGSGPRHYQPLVILPDHRVRQRGFGHLAL